MTKFSANEYKELSVIDLCVVSRVVNNTSNANTVKRIEKNRIVKNRIEKSIGRQTKTNFSNPIIS